MTVIVTKMPGGVAQIFNPDTGRIAYKCKVEQAYLKIDAFDGIVKFNQKDARAIVWGPNTSTESCEVIKNGDPGYNEALQAVLKAELEDKQNLQNNTAKEIEELQKKMS